MTSSEGKIKVVTQDNRTFDIERKVAFMSKVIENVVAAGSSEDVIKLDLVEGPTMERVLDFCEHYKDETPVEIMKPLRTADLKQHVPPWDADFINLENHDIMPLLFAANYLDVKPLIELCCAKISSRMKNKSVEEIRKEFGIVNDFTPEEEAQVRRENKWCESS
eukprot:Selendium_serpulae@DN4566_c0_g1_i3.p2